MSKFKRDHLAEKSRALARKLLAAHLGVEIPSFAIIHHKDENPFNNAISNLSIVTMAEHAKLHSGKDQRFNRKETTNRDLPKGISWESSRGKYLVQIRVGDARPRARFNTLSEAIQGRADLELKHWGFQNGADDEH